MILDMCYISELYQKQYQGQGQIITSHKYYGM